MIFNKFLQISIVILFCAFVPLKIEASILYLEPSDGEYQMGDIFLAEIRIDTQGEYINAVEANLVFPEDVLEIKDFSKGNSILSLWVKEPNFSNGLLSFAGGIPGGYYGSDGLLGRIAFRAVSHSVSHDFARVVFQDNSQVLLNDGKGTLVELFTKQAVFTILDEPFDTAQSRDEWQEELEKDIIAPKPFGIELYENFIMFSAVDKQTGIDYFEIKEEGEKDWKIIESPYLLANQNLDSIIKVKAVDKAGNERITEYIPEISEKSIPSPFWIIILIFISFSIIIYIACQKKFKK